MPKIPKNPVWKQNNYGDKFDDLWASYNLDLTSKLGTMRVTPRILLNTSSTDQATMGVPAALKEFSNGFKSIFAIAGTKCFSASSASAAFAADAGITATDFTSAQSDLEIFNGSLYATAGTSRNIYKMTSAAVYSVISNGLAVSNGLHAMTNFRAQNRLYFVDWYGTSIGSMDTSDTVVGTLGNQYTLLNLVDGVTTFITWIASTSDRIYIGTINVASNRSMIYSWDGSLVGGANSYYEIKATGTLACVIKDDVPIVIDTFGRLLQLNGGTFTELDRLPYLYGYPLAGNIEDASTLSVHRNGMAVVNNKVTFLLNSRMTNSSFDTQENIPSGIWEYTKETGLYHKASPGLAKTGDSITDYGQRFIAYAGALLPTLISGASEESYILGCSYYPSSSTIVNGIFYSDYLDTKQKAGSFVTSRIYSQNITDIWQRLAVRLRKLITSTDRLSIKYRVAETERREVTATWTSTNSFTTSTNIATASAPYPAYAVGDEVTVLSGVGAGKTAHITSLQTGATEWIVTLDETFTGATGTSAVHIQKWKKLSTLSDQSKDLFETMIAMPGNWIQFKVCMLFQYKDELNDMILTNKTNQPN